MVKGISRQVIVVHSPEPKLFEQAIFILKADAPQKGISDEELLREAQRATRGKSRAKPYLFGPVWAVSGAAVTGLAWLLTLIL